MSQRPVHVIRMGLIKAAIWRKQTRAGERHDVTLHRLYKNGEQWKESGQFGRDDLLLASKVLDAAHSWIMGTGQHSEGPAERISTYSRDALRGEREPKEMASSENGSK